MGKHCYTVMKLQKFNFFYGYLWQYVQPFDTYICKIEAEFKNSVACKPAKKLGGGGDGVKSRETISLA